MRDKPSIKLLRRFVADESGQDLVEYALLTTCIGLVGVLAWTNIKSEMFSHYAGWGSGVNGLSACTQDPGGGGCP